MVDIASATGVVEEMMMNLVQALGRNEEGFMYNLWPSLVLSDALAIF